MERPLSDDELFEALGEAARCRRRRSVSLLVSDSIPGYELRGEIHHGGQGTVFIARQLATNRDVALKVLAPGGGDRERHRFEREVALASRLRHVGIVTIHDSGCHEGRAWYAMELAPGRTLDRYLASESLTLGQHLDLFEKVVAAVAHAHRMDVVHRDLKPTNILVDDGGEPRIVDFGLALPLSTHEGATKLTATGEFVGTLAYAAPEQVAGRETDARTDVHGLGLILYEQLTRRLPWDTTGTAAEVLRRIATAPPTDVRRATADVDRELAAIVGKALERDPCRRYRSAEELSLDLERYRTGRPLDAQPHRWSYIARRAFWRHRYVLTIAGVVLALIGSTIVSVLRERSAVEERREQAAIVRELLLDVIGSSESMSHGGGRIEALEAAARDLADKAGSLGDVRATLWLALGEVHAARLDLPDAEAYFERALERFSEHGDEVGRMHALRELARVRARAGDPRAVGLAREAFEMLGGTPEAKKKALAQRLLARALAAQVPSDPGALAEARELLESCRATLVDELGDGHAEVASTDVLLARVDGHGPAAIARLELALSSLERLPGEAARTLECLEQYAQALVMADRLAEAEEVLDRSVLLTRQTFGEENTVGLLRRRASLAQLRGEPSAAERLARSALATELESWVGGRPAEGGRLTILSRRVRDDERPPWRHAFSELRALRGDGDFRLASWMNELASLVLARERPDEARELYEGALHVRCRIYGEQCPNRWQALFGLADLAASEGRVDEALVRLAELERLAAASDAKNRSANVERLGARLRGLSSEGRAVDETGSDR